MRKTIAGMAALGLLAAVPAARADEPRAADDTVKTDTKTDTKVEQSEETTHRRHGKHHKKSMKKSTDHGNGAVKDEKTVDSDTKETATGGTETKTDVTRMHDAPGEKKQKTTEHKTVERDANGNVINSETKVDH